MEAGIEETTLRGLIEEVWAGDENLLDPLLRGFNNCLFELRSREIMRWRII